MDWKGLYEQYCATPSDLNEHLPVLYRLALDCKSIVEFGVGYGKSTRAFIYSLTSTLGTLNSYDIKLHDGVQELFEAANTDGLSALFHLQSTLDVDINDTDMLFVDSHHTFEQVKGELAKHAHKVSTYIVFHDTQLYGISGQDEGTVGIMPAINEWMDANPQWVIEHEYYNNNGLLVCRRK